MTLDIGSDLWAEYLRVASLGVAIWESVFHLSAGQDMRLTFLERFA